MFHKPIYVAAGYNTHYRGFTPKVEMPSFESYLQETAKGTLDQLNTAKIDEGFIGSFMSGRYINQANLPGFLPFMVPELRYKPCTGIEGACGTGGRCIAAAVRSVLSGLSDVAFVAGFEMQNTVKSVYGSDIIAGAGYYHGERKNGHAYFFPNIFAERAGAYYEKYGEEPTRIAMAKWYEKTIKQARKNPKAQEYHNTTEDLFSLAMTPPNPKTFIPYLNIYNCSKVTDGASSLIVLSEEGRKQCGVDPKDLIEIIGMGEAEEDITKPPIDLTELSTTKEAVQKAFAQAKIKKEEIVDLELHDCFGITALLAFEAIGFAKKGEGAHVTFDRVNLSGGLSGFGHPTGATGVRQMVDLQQQCKEIGMMISMGGNDKTVTCFIVRRHGV